MTNSKYNYGLVNAQKFRVTYHKTPDKNDYLTANYAQIIKKFLIIYATFYTKLFRWQWLAVHLRFQQFFEFNYQCLCLFINKFNDNILIIMYAPENN